MDGVDPVKLLKTMASSFLFILPLFFWLILGGTGVFGAFSETETYNTVTIIFIIIVAIGCTLVIPIFVWPRIWNGEDTRDDILRKGRPAKGVIRSVGGRGAEGVRWRKRSNTYIRTSIEVSGEGPDYVVDPHLALVPDTILPFLKEGMEVPVMVSRHDGRKIAIVWEPLLEHYPETPDRG